MRIHTNTAGADDIQDAADLAGVTIEHIAEHGSRSRSSAFEVRLSGSSPRMQNGGRQGATGEHAATWDEWGMFLAHVFSVDPRALTRDYDGARHFHWATTGRYHISGEVHGQECRTHRWRYAGERPPEGDFLNHTLHRCAKCGALIRREG